MVKRFAAKRDFDRLTFLTITIFILGILIIGRLFELQILGHKFYQSLTSSRNKAQEIIKPIRGKIFIYQSKGSENLYPIAINSETYNLYAVPAEIDQPIETAEKLAPFLGIPWSAEKISTPNQSDVEEIIQETDQTVEFKNLINRLSKKNDFYELLKKNLTLDEVKKIQALQIKGINFETVPGRFYPEKNLFSHLVGFLGTENDQPKGQYGLEEYFEDLLVGQPGIFIGEKGPGGYLITTSKQIFKKSVNGADLILTIDRPIQFKACELLNNALKDYQAERGTIIVSQPETGAILALCNQPDFDPNKYTEAKVDLFKNIAISDAFEPGSIFKVITMAAALDSQKITPETTYVDTGEVKIGGHTIENSDKKANGLKTMTNVLEKSINTGAVYAVRLVGRDLFRNYLKKFGFGNLTEIELPAEASGDISNLIQPQEIYLATSSFGQGISVTSIQMLNAVSAIANQGRLMKPYLVEKIISAQGESALARSLADSGGKEDGQVTEIEPKFIRQVISPAVATTLKAMMVSVLENGYGKLARVPGYYVAGKTGTAQVPKMGGGYTEKTIHSFVGFAPVDRPVFVALVKLDNPKKGRFSESTAAPVFGKLAEFILKYYRVPPER